MMANHAKVKEVCRRARGCAKLDRAQLGAELEPAEAALGELAEQIAGLKVRAHLAIQHAETDEVRASMASLAMRLVASERHLNKALESLQLLGEGVAATLRDLAAVERLIAKSDGAAP